MTAALDFEIDIGAGDEHGYSVNMRTPDGGKATAVMVLPPAEVAALAARIPDAVIASSAMVRRSLTSQERPVRELGSDLGRMSQLNARLRSVTTGPLRGS